jgi:hypothetical protein
MRGLDGHIPGTRRALHQRAGVGLVAVVGKIPLWGSGRSLIVFKTGSDRFDLDVVED